MNEEKSITKISETEVVKEHNNSPVHTGIARAVIRLRKELAETKDKDFSSPIIGHLIERCKESESLASDICQEHKTWEKCFSYT